MTDIAMFREGSREPNRTDPPKEHELRRDLAAAYRLAALFGWDDLIATHFSVRLPSAPGEPEAFLLNQYGILFEEITASSLVKVDVEGDILSDSDEPVNKAGFVVHSAVHQARPDAGCVMHLHTEDGVAVSALDEGLLPLNQTAMIVAGRVSVHEYEGVAVDLGERERLVADLGDNDLMFLRNHGTLAVGATVAEAFSRMYTLEKACTFQVKTLGMGRPCRMPDPAVVDKMKAGPRRNEQSAAYARNYVWPALLRKLDRLCPDYRN